jgi:hypothetical protein
MSRIQASSRIVDNGSLTVSAAERVNTKLAFSGVVDDTVTDSIYGIAFLDDIISDEI